MYKATRENTFEKVHTERMLTVRLQKTARCGCA